VLAGTFVHFEIHDIFGRQTELLMSQTFSRKIKENDMKQQKQKAMLRDELIDGILSAGRRWKI